MERRQTTPAVVVGLMVFYLVVTVSVVIAGITQWIYGPANWSSFWPDLLVGALTGVAVGAALVVAERYTSASAERRIAHDAAASEWRRARADVFDSLQGSQSHADFADDAYTPGTLVDFYGPFRAMDAQYSLVGWAARVPEDPELAAVAHLSEVLVDLDAVGRKLNAALVSYGQHDDRRLIAAHMYRIRLAELRDENAEHKNGHQVYKEELAEEFVAAAETAHATWVETQRKFGVRDNLA